MTPEEVATLRRLTQEFKDELAGLGNSINAINRKLDALAARLGALETYVKGLPKIYGGAFLGIRSDRAHGGFVDYDGRVMGLGAAGLVSTPAVVHEYVLGVTANIPGGATIDAALLSGNYKNFLGGNTAQIRPLNTNELSDTYVHHLEINTPFTGLGRGSKLTLGRFGEKLGHLTLWKPDVDRYFMNPFEDNGQYYIDGARLSTNFGSVNFEVAAGQTKSVTGANGEPWNSPLAGAANTGIGSALFAGNGKPIGQPAQGQMTIDELITLSAGFNFNALGKGGHLRLTALDGAATKASSVGNGFSNVLVLGADADLKLADRLALTADWGKSITGMGRFKTVNPYENTAFNASLGWSSGGLSINGGYKYIDPLFYAPGYWGRIGNWINPTNIQGPTVRAAFDFTPGFGVNVGGDFFSAARNRALSGGIGRDDEINRILVGLRWDVAKNFRTTVDWEGVYWKLQGAHSGIPAMGGGTVHPTEQYITLGTGYNLTSNTLLKLGYTIGDFNGHGALDGGPGLNKYNFNTFTTQVAVKF